VVDSAKPSWLEARIVAAAELCAAIPCTGAMSTTPLPSIRMIRQPPSQVPSAIADAAESLTQNGIALVSVQSPDPIRASVMMPIVFWASFVPCAKDTSEALPI